jgi:hypothetical protein
MRQSNSESFTWASESEVVMTNKLYSGISTENPDMVSTARISIYSMHIVQSKEKLFEYPVDISEIFDPQNIWTDLHLETVAGIVWLWCSYTSENSESPATSQGLDHRGFIIRLELLLEHRKYFKGFEHRFSLYSLTSKMFEFQAKDFQTIVIPDTLRYWPWARDINPHYEECKRESAAWAESFKAFSPKAQIAFNKCDFSGCLLITSSKSRLRGHRSSGVPCFLPRQQG